MIRIGGTMFVAVFGLLAPLAGCENDQQEAMEAERDLAEARREGAQDVAKARQEASQDLREARQEAAQDLNKAAREAAQDVNAVQREVAQDLNAAQREASQEVAEAQRDAHENVAEAQHDVAEAVRDAQQPGLGTRIANAITQHAGMGSVHGKIMLTGATAPTPTPLARVAGCDGMPANDENIVVNSNHTLRNVIVRLVGNVPGPVDVPSDTLDIDQDDCMFSPRVAAIVAGQTIQVERTNGELTVPTLRGTGPFARAQLGATPLETQVSPSGGLITFRDPARPWMRAHVMVLNHDHFDVSDNDGEFTLANVPPGTYAIESWQEQLGRKTSRVIVRADQVSNVDFNYTGTETGGFADARTAR